MSRVRWSPRSLTDLRRFHAFLHSKSPRSAFEAVAKIRSATKQLEVFPNSGRPIEADNELHRELSVHFGSGGYLVRYSHDGEDVLIVAIRHFLEDDF